MYTIEQVKNAMWMNAEHTLIECEVKFAEMNDFIPFGATIDGDQYAHTKQVFDLAVSGVVAEYVAPVIPEENQPTTTGAQTL